VHRCRPQRRPIERLDASGRTDFDESVKIVINDTQTPIAHVIEFFSRSTKRGEKYRENFQKMYDEGIRIALKYFGE